MIATFILYASTVSLLIGVAAWLAEQALHALHRATRTAWVAGIAFSLVIPLLMLVPEPAAESSSIVASPTETAVDTLPVQLMPPSTPTAPTAPQLEWPQLRSFDDALRPIWIGTSITLAAFYLAAWLSLARRARCWTATHSNGARVLVSDDVGPAIFGFWKSQIVLPRGLLESDAATVRLAVAHETQHIAARDPLCLLLGLVATLVMPWNVALWWQLHRLRFAVEVDCDARVLRTGVSATRYGDALLAVARYRGTVPFAAVALLEPLSTLEKRIATMLKKNSRHPLLVATACLGACFAVLATAAQLDAPRDTSSLVLTPPEPGMLTKVGNIVRARHAHLFTERHDGPTLLNLLLNNDFTVDLAQEKSLPVGMTLDQASPPDAANNGFDAAVLYPRDPRWGGQFVLNTDTGGDVLVNFAVRGVSKTRSVALVEPAIRSKFPQLYSHATKERPLVIALFNDDGTLATASYVARTDPAILHDRKQQLEQLSQLGIAAERIGVTYALPGQNSPTPMPAILYGFPKSADPAIDLHPLNPETRTDVQAQTRIVERYFPDAHVGQAHAHELLWVLVNATGDVTRTGRDRSSVVDLANRLATLIPGAQMTANRTRPVGELFGREILDVQNEPLLITFVWYADAPNTRPDVLVDAQVYRNGQALEMKPFSLPFGQLLASEIGEGNLRLQMSAIRRSDEEIMLRLRVQARAQRLRSEFDDPWNETVLEPSILTKYGSETVTEFGMQYPGAATGTVWRLVLTPRRAPSVKTAATAP